MTVLVTGGMGYIGSHTCVELLEQGMDVVVVDNLVNSSAEAGKRVEQITGRPLKFYQMDVRDRAGLDRIFTEQKIDCVIHFPGLKAVVESVQMPLEYYDNNLGSTITLCEAMRDHGVRQIIFSSSATVYSGDNEMPLYETSRTGNCTNPYGWTKYVCEQILRDYVVADPSWSVVLLRYFNPIGAHPSGLIGADAHVRLIGRRHDDDLAGCLAEKALGELTGHRGAVDGLAAVALRDRHRARLDGDAVIEARLAGRFIDGGAQRLQGLLVEGKGDVDGNAVARRLHTLRKTAVSAHGEGAGDQLAHGKPRAQRAALGDPHLLVGPGLL